MVVVVTKVDKLSKVELFAACSNFQRMFAKAIPTDDIETEGGWEQVATPSAGTFDDAQRRAGSDSLPVVLFSAVTGFGQGDLWKVIRDNLIAP